MSQETDTPATVKKTSSKVTVIDANTIRVEAPEHSVPSFPAVSKPPTDSKPPVLIIKPIVPETVPPKLSKTIPTFIAPRHIRTLPKKIPPQYTIRSGSPAHGVNALTVKKTPSRVTIIDANTIRVEAPEHSVPSFPAESKPSTPPRRIPSFIAPHHLPKPLPSLIPLKLLPDIEAPIHEVNPPNENPVSIKPNVPITSPGSPDTIQSKEDDKKILEYARERLAPKETKYITHEIIRGPDVPQTIPVQLEELFKKHRPVDYTDFTNKKIGSRQNGAYYYETYQFAWKSITSASDKALVTKIDKYDSLSNSQRKVLFTDLTKRLPAYKVSKSSSVDYIAGHLASRTDLKERLQSELSSSVPIGAKNVQYRFSHIDPIFKIQKGKSGLQHSIKGFVTYSPPSVPIQKGIDISNLLSSHASKITAIDKEILANPPHTSTYYFKFQSDSATYLESEKKRIRAIHPTASNFSFTWLSGRRGRGVIRYQGKYTIATPKGIELLAKKTTLQSQTTYLQHHVRVNQHKDRLDSRISMFGGSPIQPTIPTNPNNITNFGSIIEPKSRLLFKVTVDDKDRYFKSEESAQLFIDRYEKNQPQLQGPPKPIYQTEPINRDYIGSLEHVFNPNRNKTLVEQFWEYDRTKLFDGFFKQSTYDGVHDETLGFAHSTLDLPRTLGIDFGKDYQKTIDTIKPPHTPPVSIILDQLISGKPVVGSGRGIVADIAAFNTFAGLTALSIVATLPIGGVGGAVVGGVKIAPHLVKLLRTASVIKSAKASFTLLDNAPPLIEKLGRGKVLITRGFETSNTKSPFIVIDKGVTRIYSTIDNPLEVLGSKAVILDTKVTQFSKLEKIAKTKLVDKFVNSPSVVKLSDNIKTASKDIKKIISKDEVVQRPAPVFDTKVVKDVVKFDKVKQISKGFYEVATPKRKDVLKFVDSLNYVVPVARVTEVSSKAFGKTVVTVLRATEDSRFLTQFKIKTIAQSKFPDFIKDKFFGFNTAVSKFSRDNLVIHGLKGNNLGGVSNVLSSSKAKPAEIFLRKSEYVSGAKLRGGKSAGGKSAGGKSAGGKTSSKAKPSEIFLRKSEYVSGAKPRGGKSAGGKSAGGKSSDVKSEFDKIFGGKSSGGKSAGGKSAGGKSAGGKSAGGKSSVSSASSQSQSLLSQRASHESLKKTVIAIEKTVAKPDNKTLSAFKSLIDDFKVESTVASSVVTLSKTKSVNQEDIAHTIPALESIGLSDYNKLVSKSKKVVTHSNPIHVGLKHYDPFPIPKVNPPLSNKDFKRLVEDLEAKTIRPKSRHVIPILSPILFYNIDQIYGPTEFETFSQTLIDLQIQKQKQEEEFVPLQITDKPIIKEVPKQVIIPTNRFVFGVPLVNAQKAEIGIKARKKYLKKYSHDFLGNVFLDKVVGNINRTDIIYGDKKTARVLASQRKGKHPYTKKSNNPKIKQRKSSTTMKQRKSSTTIKQRKSSMTMKPRKANNILKQRSKRMR